MLSGGAAFACLLMLKHLFLALAPLYFVYLLRSYCCCWSCESAQSQTDGAIAHDAGGGGRVGKPCKGKKIPQTPSPGGDNDPQPTSTASGPRALERAVQHGGTRTAGTMTMRISWARLLSLGSVVLCVFASALGPLCVSEGMTREACLKQLGQLGVRLFPFGRRVQDPREHIN